MLYEPMSPTRGSLMSRKPKFDLWYLLYGNSFPWGKKEKKNIDPFPLLQDLIYTKVSSLKYLAFITVVSMEIWQIKFKYFLHYYFNWMITPGKTQRVERKDWMLAQVEAKATGNDSVVKQNKTHFLFEFDHIVIRRGIILTVVCISLCLTLNCYVIYLYCYIILQDLKYIPIKWVIPFTILQQKVIVFWSDKHIFLSIVK